MEFQLKKRAGQPLYVEPEFTRVSENIVIASTLLQDPHGRQERYQVVTFFGSGKAIFMAASAHAELHPTENVGEVVADDHGPVPDGGRFLGEDWMIDRYEH